MYLQTSTRTWHGLLTKQLPPTISVIPLLYLDIVSLKSTRTDPPKQTNIQKKKKVDRKVSSEDGAAGAAGRLGPPLLLGRSYFRTGGAWVYISDPVCRGPAVCGGVTVCEFLPVSRLRDRPGATSVSWLWLVTVWLCVRDFGDFNAG